MEWSDHIQNGRKHTYTIISTLIPSLLTQPSAVPSAFYFITIYFLIWSLTFMHCCQLVAPVPSFQLFIYAQTRTVPLITSKRLFSLAARFSRLKFAIFIDNFIKVVSEFHSLFHHSTTNCHPLNLLQQLADPTNPKNSCSTLHIGTYLTDKLESNLN